MSRVSEDARECAVFLGYSVVGSADPAEMHARGTGFLVYSGEGGTKGVYLVTAAHIARKLGADPFAIRLNDFSGNARLDYRDNTTWYYDDDPAVDVAVCRYEMPDWSGAQVLPVSEFMDGARYARWQIGPGDVVYIIGLFYLHAGKRRNLPIVHTGTIALMASDEKIPVERDDSPGVFDEVDAFLVEAHALTGASGSPVMIRPTVRHMVKSLRDNEEALALSEGRDYLFGIWVAAWPGRPSALLTQAAGASEWVPLGIGLVIPCGKIVGILQRYELVSERREAMDLDKQKNAAQQTGLGAPSKPAPPTTEGDEQHKERFTSLLDAAARKRPPAD